MSYTEDQIRRAIRKLFAGDGYGDEVRRVFFIHLMATRNRDVPFEFEEKIAEAALLYHRFAERTKDADLDKTIPGIMFGNFYDIACKNPQVDVYLQVEEGGRIIHLLGGINDDNRDSYLLPVEGDEDDRRYAASLYRNRLGSMEASRRRARLVIDD